MINQEIRYQIDCVFSEVNYLIQILYMIDDRNTRNFHLYQLWTKCRQLQMLVKLWMNQTLPPAIPPSPPSPMLPSQPPQTLPDITREQLSRYNGKNGFPAYVAVNQTVYDVTNNAAWSAASHFGLSAGKDLTSEFASCHAGQQWILRTLKPVGRLVP